MAKKEKKPVDKKKVRNIILASVGGLALIGSGVAIGYFCRDTITYLFDRNGNTTIDNVKSEFQAEPYFNPVTQKNWKYVSSTENKIGAGSKDEKLKDETMSAHVFLLGNINNVPFYQSAWALFNYENINITITYSEIKEESITNAESTSTEKTESRNWSSCQRINNKLEVGVSAGIGPVKASAKNTLDITMTKESSGSTSTKYVSNSSQTKGSVESLSKTADYSIQLNSENGFKKGKYYRLSLQQTATEYLIVYEYADKNATSEQKYDEGSGKYYELVSYLANPSDYTMVIEEADNPDEQSAGTMFSDSVLDECTKWIEEQRSKATEEGCEFDYVSEEGEDVKVRKELLDSIFKGAPEMDSDIYERNNEYRIDDDGRDKNPCDVISFETLFSSRYSPTFAELFNTEADGGYGYQNFSVTIECEVRQYDRGDNHIYLMNTIESNIPKKVLWENNTDYDTKSWTKVRYTTSTYGENDIRTSMEKDKADGKIVIRYDGSGASDDDWGVRNLRVRVHIS